MPKQVFHPAPAPGPRLVSVNGKTYPLGSVSVTARAEGGIAVTTLAQRFLNPHDEPLEVIYTLPLPADGAVLAYDIRIGDRVIRGEIQTRETAANAYREALYQGRTAGLLEQDRADTFCQRLGNVPPRSPVEVRIDVLQPLRFLAAIDDRAAHWEYRFPTVAGVRYEGAPGRVDDARRLDVDRGHAGEIPTRAEFEIEIVRQDGVEPRPESPSHDIVVSDSRVKLAHSARLDRDLVLRWNACAPAVGVNVTEGHGLAGDDGRYALVTIVPPEVPGETFQRDLTVLIDASGSMNGRPLELAKRVVIDLLRSLGPDDRFELIAFASSPTRLVNSLERADARSIQRAIDRVRHLEASGGTEMLHAVEEALASLRKDAQRQIVLVTDGQIGFENEVVGHLLRHLPIGCRVHAVGIGAAPNRALLCSVAGAGRGLELCASDDDAAGEAARRLIGGTSRPLITELTLAGSAVRDHAPGRPRDVFAGQPALLAVELEARGGSIELGGQMAGTSARWTWSTSVPAADAGERQPSPLPLGALFGREKIGDFELRRAARGDENRLDAEIEACGLRHRIVSRRTSLVAISEDITVDPNAPRRRERLAVEVPDWVSAEGVGLTVAFDGRALYGLPEAEAAGAPRSPKRSASIGNLMKGLFRPQLESLSSVPGVHIEATIVRIEGRQVTVEFEVPFDGFELPRGKVIVVASDGSTSHADVIRERSSPTGPHAAGLRVKLTVRARQAKSPEDGLELQFGADGNLIRLRAAAAREAT